MTLELGGGNDVSMGICTSVFVAILTHDDVALWNNRQVFTRLESFPSRPFEIHNIYMRDPIHK